MHTYKSKSSNKKYKENFKNLPKQYENDGKPSPSERHDLILD